MTNEQFATALEGAWGPEITQRFVKKKAADPSIFAKELPGLSRLVRALKDLDKADDSDVKAFLLEAIEFGDESQPETVYRVTRANRAAARGFLLLGSQPDADDLARIQAGNTKLDKIVFGDKKFRDTWAAILYDRVAAPGSDSKPSQRTGRRHRDDAAKALVDAVALFAGNVIEEQTVSAFHEGEAVEPDQARLIEPFVASESGSNATSSLESQPKRRGRYVAAGVLAIVLVVGAGIALRPSIFPSSCTSASAHCLPQKASAGSPKGASASTINSTWSPASLKFAETCNGDEPPTSSSEIVNLEFQQPGECWSPSSRFDPTQPINLLIEYLNRTGKVANNVSASLSLPKGLSLMPATTYYGSSDYKDGIFASGGSITTTGLNFGSYDSGANVWVITRLSVSKSLANMCGLHGYDISAKVLSDQNRASGTPPESKSVVYFYKKC